MRTFATVSFLVVAIAVSIPADGAMLVGADADARIRGGSSSGTNFGAGNLFAKANASLSVSRKFYIAFDVSSLVGMPLGLVELLLTKQNTDAGAPASKVHNVFGIIDNADWDTGTLAESSINWDNAPKNSTSSATGFVGQGSTSSDASRLLDSVTVFKTDPTGTEYRFDVTEYVRWALGNNASFSTFASSDSDQSITFMIAWDSVVAGDTYTFFSKENDPLLGPQLAAVAPEPSSLALLLMGAAGLVAHRRRRTR